MTTEQLKELSESLSVLSAKSSVLKERRELRALMEENLQAEEVFFAAFPFGPSLVKRGFTGSQVAFRRIDKTNPVNVD